ncbi:expressed unknown protein [Ectocarpus siliculosus]|uniref:Uncharacterized protein n=1 Tax=Ectocarpus siliculosus TaxID=2880 RepID=D8LBM9_ECTSI|nr:expressed unknown protein [Ectocarpus siliculosus]|eukprot:CBN76738.1 expressed unknown protein [Ectocarpus siliculosus]
MRNWLYVHTSVLHRSTCTLVICRYSRLLVVNETGLLKLRAGLGPAGNRFGLGQLPVESLPEVAKVVACTVVRTRRGDGSGGGGGGGGGGGRTPGIVCVAMLVPPLPASAAVAVGNHGGGGGGTKQGDAAGGPAVRAAAATAAGGGGLLNVYPLDGERGSEVDRALRREPQQLVLPYMPVGMAHTTVWRSVAALPNFVGGGGSGAGEGAGASSSSSPTNNNNNNNRRVRVERGDAVLVWDQSGMVHGYTRWEGGGDRRTAADSSTSRGGGGGGTGSGGGATGHVSILTAESRESLETLMPELRGIDSPVSCLAFDAVEEGDGWARRRRRVLAGCMESARCVSLHDAASGRRETAVASVPGPVGAVALNARPRFMPYDRHVDDRWGGNVAGFACTELDMLAWLVEGGNAAGAGVGGRWYTGSLPLVEAGGGGGDQVTCMECADFFRDGSTAVAIGTNLGKVIVYSAEPNNGGGEGGLAGGLEEVGRVDAGGRSGGEGLVFGLEVDGDDSSEEDEAGCSSNPVQPPSRRGDSVSPRPSGLASSSADRQFHSRRVADRQGGGGSREQQQQQRPLLTARWQRDLPHGVLRIAFGDFNHDGVRELVVATQYGVHVFRPDYRAEASRFAKTMHALKMLQPKEDDGGDFMSSASDNDHDGRHEGSRPRGADASGMETHGVGAAASDGAE